MVQNARVFTLWLVNALGATAACHFSTIFRHQNFKKWSDTVSFWTFWVENVLLATAVCKFCTSQLHKMARSWCVFVHFDFETRFSLQRRAMFRHRHFKKCSETVNFLTCWLENVLLANFKKWSETISLLPFSIENVLLATAACNFCTSQLQKMVRDRQFLTFWVENALLATAACNFSTPNSEKWSEHGVFCAF